MTPKTRGGLRFAEGPKAAFYEARIHMRPILSIRRQRQKARKAADAMFRRYAIMSDGDLRDAVANLAAANRTTTGTIRLNGHKPQ